MASLGRYRTLVLQDMSAAVPRREPGRYLYSPINEYVDRPSKCLRPALCLASCLAHGGEIDRARPTAAALEMLHNAFLVHDDIEDQSEFRRGLPAMHQTYGVPLAVNIGDMMNALSMRMLQSNASLLGPTLSGQVMEEFNHLLIEALEGQALEIGWIHENRHDVRDDEYLRMALKKTCWYSFVHPCRLGALIAQPTRCDLDRFNRFGYFLGLAFQIQDDLLNLTGDHDTYGKEIGGDLLEGKRTLMLIHLLRNLPSGELVRAMTFLGSPRDQRDVASVDWMLSRMRDLGSLEYGRVASRRFAGAALYEFEHAFGTAPESLHKSFIHDVIRYMVEREK